MWDLAANTAALWFNHAKSGCHQGLEGSHGRSLAFGKSAMHLRGYAASHTIFRGHAQSRVLFGSFCLCECDTNEAWLPTAIELDLGHCLATCRPQPQSFYNNTPIEILSGDVQEFKTSSLFYQDFLNFDYFGLGDLCSAVCILRLPVGSGFSVPPRRRHPPTRRTPEEKKAAPVNSPARAATKTLSCRQTLLTPVFPPHHTPTVTEQRKWPPSLPLVLAPPSPLSSYVAPNRALCCGPGAKLLACAAQIFSRRRHPASPLHQTLFPQAERKTRKLY